MAKRDGEECGRPIDGPIESDVSVPSGPRSCGTTTAWLCCWLFEIGSGLSDGGVVS